MAKSECMSVSRTIETVELLEVANFSAYLSPYDAFIKKVGIVNFLGLDISIIPCNGDYISIFVKKSYMIENQIPLHFVCVASVVDVEGTLSFAQSFGCNFRKLDSAVVGLEDYVKRRILLDNSKELLPNDVLKLHLELSYSPVTTAADGDVDVTTEEARNVIDRSLFTVMNPQEKASDHGVNLKSWDFTIKTLNGTKLVLFFMEGIETLGSKLCDASPVFRSMMETPMLECLEREVTLLDVDYKTLMIFLTYIDTGNLLLQTDSEVLKVYEMADKYEVLNLMTACGRYMVQNATLENITDILTLANIHSDENLKAITADFFRSKTVVLLKKSNASDGETDDRFTFIDREEQRGPVIFEENLEEKFIPEFTSDCEDLTPSLPDTAWYKDALFVKQFNDTYQFYELAEKYDVQKLKQECCRYMKENMPNEDAENVLKFAKNYKDVELYTHAKSFIKINHSFSDGDELSFKDDSLVFKWEVASSSSAVKVFNPNYEDSKYLLDDVESSADFEFYQ